MYPTCKLLLVENWPISPNQQQGPLLEISYIPLLELELELGNDWYLLVSVMSTLHYHRLYQI